MLSFEPMIIIDISNIKSIEELHTKFAKALNFPEYYGHNWDAFWDCISDMEYMPDRLILKNWDKFEKTFKADAKILKSIIDDYNKENNAIIIIP